MVVDSMISASGREYSMMSSWTRLLAQITTSASPMCLAPRTVRRSGAPGPAPINHTLPKLRSPPGEDNGGQIGPLATYHLSRRHDLFALDPEPGPVHGVLQPSTFLRNPEYLPEPAPAL